LRNMIKLKLLSQCNLDFEETVYVHLQITQLICYLNFILYMANPLSYHLYPK